MALPLEDLFFRWLGLEPGEGCCSPVEEDWHYIDEPNDIAFDAYGLERSERPRTSRGKGAGRGSTRMTAPSNAIASTLATGEYGEEESGSRAGEAAAPSSSRSHKADGPLLALAPSQVGIFPRGPRRRGIPMYSTGYGVELQGSPIKSGNLTLCKLGQTVEKARLSIYSNGYSVTPAADSADAAGGNSSLKRAWSPFTLVENCKVDVSDSLGGGGWAVFKLTSFNSDPITSVQYFATGGWNSLAERKRWVEAISDCLSDVVLSLFPPKKSSVQPIADKPGTSTRVLAGYLLRTNGVEEVSLVFVELHCQGGSRGTASRGTIVIYEDEFCEAENDIISFNQSTMVCTRSGVFCTVFGVDDFFFAARSQEDKETWLRAVTNVKTKLICQAPPPTELELESYRESVQRRLDSVEMVHGQEGSNTAPTWRTPILGEVRRAPDISAPAGDVLACDFEAEFTETGDDEQEAAEISKAGTLPVEKSEPRDYNKVPAEPAAINSTTHVTSKPLEVKMPGPPAASPHYGFSRGQAAPTRVPPPSQGHSDTPELDDSELSEL